METYNSQTNSVSASQNLITQNVTGGIELPFRINKIDFKINTNKILFTHDDSGITPEEENNYYQKTLKSKLV